LASRPGSNLASAEGEMWEWNVDWYASSYGDPCTDCADLSSASYRVIRGGHFDDVPYYLLPPTRNYYDPSNRGGTGGGGFGVRCARTP
jgi:formylglycine-generating enzyme